MKTINLTFRFIPNKEQSAEDFSGVLLRHFSDGSSPFKIDSGKTPRFVEPVKDGLYSASLTKALPKGVRGTWRFTRRTSMGTDSRYDDWIKIQYSHKLFDFSAEVVPFMLFTADTLQPYFIEAISDDMEFEALQKFGIPDSRAKLAFLPPAGILDSRFLARVSEGLIVNDLRRAFKEGNSAVRNWETKHAWQPTYPDSIDQAMAIPMYG